jgi:hypothetical protein
MKIRTFALTTAAALFVAGSAFAQSNNGNASQGTGQNGPTSPMGTGSNSDKGAGSTMKKSDMKSDSNMTTSSTSGSMYKSDEEKMMYQKNADMMRPFFTDDSMSKLKSESEIKSTYQGMDAQSQASLKKTCDTATGQRGSYGTMTMTLCSTIEM